MSKAVKDRQRLREKVMEAIIYTERFWMILKNGTFGMAGFLDLHYKKSYIEIIFFTPEDSKKFNNQVIQIATPLLMELNFDKIYENPVIDDDGIINPTDVIKNIERLVDDEIQGYIFIRDNEIREINEEFENYEVADNPYHRKIIYYLQNGDSIDFEINFENFPKRPIIEFSKKLKKIIKLEEFLKLDFLENWNEKNPVSVLYIIENLINQVNNRLDIKNIPKDSQVMIFNELLFFKDIEPLSYRLRRGQSMGIFAQGHSMDVKLIHSRIMKIFRIISGTDHPSGGNIKLFGENLIDTTAAENIFIVTTTIDSNLAEKKVKQALIKNITISSKLPNLRTNKQLKKEVLKSVGLENQGNMIVAELKPIEKLRFSLARALLQNPTIILILVPENALGRLDVDQFNRSMRKIQEKFHLILIIHGSREVISTCDKILNISDTNAEAGSIQELVMKIPQSGEIITIELDNPNPDILNNEKLSSIIQGAIFIEERPYEKYKIFSEEDPDKLIIDIMNVLGPFIYNFKRIKPTLTEYLEFMEII